MKLEQIYVALDQMNQEEIQTFLNRSKNKIKSIKIGLELYLKYGPALIYELKKNYHLNIFLDLKLHDIPTTVHQAISSLKDLPLDLLTIHLSGGEAMLKAAHSARQNFLPQTKLLGVSFLTSLTTQDTQKIFSIELNDMAYSKLFQLALENNIDGIVHSPLEKNLVEKKFSKLFSVTPGIRFKREIILENNIEDQKRIMAIEDIHLLSKDFLVIGRSLTKINSAEKLQEKLDYIESL